MSETILQKRTLKLDCINLIERKLVGAQRQAALRWAWHNTRPERYTQLMKRLEPLPDTGAPHSLERWSPEKKAAVRADYAANMKLSDISAKHGVPEGTIGKMVKDLPRRQPGRRRGERPGPATIKAARDMYAAGYPIAQICQTHQMATSTLYEIVADLPRRIAPKKRAAK